MLIGLGARGCDLLVELGLQPRPLLWRDPVGEIVGLYPVTSGLHAVPLRAGVLAQRASLVEPLRCLALDHLARGVDIERDAMKVGPYGRVDHLALDRRLRARLDAVMQPFGAHVAFVILSGRSRALADGRHGRATAAAQQSAREEVRTGRASTSAASGRLSERRAALCGCLPRLRVDDRRNGRRAVCGYGGIALVADRHTARIEPVLEHPGDRGRVPLSAGQGRYLRPFSILGGVESVRDRALRRAGEILGEDPPNDRGLGLVDHERPGSAAVRPRVAMPVAKRPSTSDELATVHRAAPDARLHGRAFALRVLVVSHAADRAHQQAQLAAADHLRVLQAEQLDARFCRPEHDLDQVSRLHAIAACQPVGVLHDQRTRALFGCEPLSVLERLRESRPAIGLERGRGLVAVFGDEAQTTRLGELARVG